MAPNRRQTLSRPDVSYGSKADVTLLNLDVRFAPKSGHSPARSGCLLWADFVVEVGLEGRVGWADDFLRPVVSRQPDTGRPL